MLGRIMGEAKLNAHLSEIAPATRRRYLSVWNQRAYFTSTRDQPYWLIKRGPDWGERLIDFVMFETHVTKNTSDMIQVKVPAMRFWRNVCGIGDFSKLGGRYRQALKGMKRTRKINREIPFSLDILIG